MHSTLPLKVLIVDDNPSDSAILRRFLKKIPGLSFDTSEQSEMDPDNLLPNHHDFDLIFLDYHLGSCTGLEVLKAIRDAGNDVPVIACTGWGNEDVAVEAMKLGAQDYLVKGSIRAETLGRTVSRVIESVAHERQIRQRNEQLKQFVNAASHDISSPLRRISAFAELVEEEVTGKLGAQVDEWIGTIRSDVQRLNDLIEGLMQFTRIGRAAISPQPVDLQRLVTEIVSRWEHHYEGGVAQIRVAPLPVVQGHESLLWQLMENLVANALKYNQSRSLEVTIDAKREGDWWRIAVSDNGIGIEPDNQQVIFEPFRRLHTCDEFTGSGIGLATCKKVAEQHGGRIWVVSQMGQGATFFVTLPAADIPAPERPAAQSPGDQSPAVWGIETPEEAPTEACPAGHSH